LWTGTRRKWSRSIGFSSRKICSRLTQLDYGRRRRRRILSDLRPIDWHTALLLSTVESAISQKWSQDISFDRL
jgi:hypothetical protein